MHSDGVLVCKRLIARTHLQESDGPQDPKVTLAAVGGSKGKMRPVTEREELRGIQIPTKIKVRIGYRSR